MLAYPKASGYHKYHMAGTSPHIETLHLGLLSYREGLELQESYREMVKRADGSYLLLLQHHPVITNGRFAGDNNFTAARKLLEERGVEVYKTDRGGDLTYHGPGQLVGYPILSLRQFKLRPRDYIQMLEEALIRTLSEYGIESHRAKGYPGVWVTHEADSKPAKIASIGVSVKNGITSHGFALNVNTDLSYFSLIVPCGIPGVEITSMNNLLGQGVDMDKVAGVFSGVFKDLLESRSGIRAKYDERITLSA